MIRCALLAALLALCAAAQNSVAQYGSIQYGVADTGTMQDSIAHDGSMPLLPGDFPAWTFRLAETYRKQALYGYIDGGAELYYEYGFDSLVVLTAARGAGELQIEAYRMASPEAAFGIYSVSRRYASCDTGYPAWICTSSEGIALHRGCWYVTLRGIDTGRSRRPFTDRIAQLAAARIPADGCLLPALFLLPALDGCRDAVVLLAGASGANIAAADYAELLDGMDGARLWLASCAGGREVGCFRARTPEQNGRFLERFMPGMYPEAGERWKVSRAAGGTSAVRAGTDSELWFVRSDGKDPGFEEFLKHLK